MSADLSAAELIAERADEHLPLDRLAPWLAERVPGAVGVPRVAQFGGGHANLTYCLSCPERDVVLRRPPLGPVAAGAHDMAREHRVLAGLAPLYPLAPESLVHCEDASVIGAPFVVVERRRGFVVRRDLPERFHDRPDLNARLGATIVDALADLHRVDARAAGLGDPARAEGFRARQLDGWTQRWHAASEGARPQAGPVLAYLAAALPARGPVAVVHNDYKLDNLLVDADDPARATAVLDWDMCTLGDPLMDLGYLLNYWAEPGDDPAWIAAAAMPTWRPGFPSRAEAVARYRTRTGFDLSALHWYRVFGIFKLAVILEQIHLRWRRGQTRDARFATFDARITGLIGKARALVDAAGG